MTYASNKKQYCKNGFQNSEYTFGDRNDCCKSHEIIGNSKFAKFLNVSFASIFFSSTVNSLTLGIPADRVRSPERLESIDHPGLFKSFLENISQLSFWLIVRMFESMRREAIKSRFNFEIIIVFLIYVYCSPTIFLEAQKNFNLNCLKVPRLSKLFPLLMLGENLLDTNIYYYRDCSQPLLFLRGLEEK